SAEDGDGSGVNHYNVYANNDLIEAQLYYNSITVDNTNSPVIYEVEAVDQAGNKSDKLQILVADMDPTPSTTTLQGPATGTVGQPLLYIANVEGAPVYHMIGKTYAGEVSFYIDDVFYSKQPITEYLGGSGSFA